MKHTTIKKKTKKCQVCKRRPRAKYRTLCGSCAAKAWRAKDPVRYAYIDLKAHAKERGKLFTITLEDFRQFCVKTEYLAGRGKTSDSYHVDRIDESKGYVPGNLQVLTNAENVRKYLNYDWQTGAAFVVTVRPATEKDLPF